MSSRLCVPETIRTTIGIIGVVLLAACTSGPQATISGTIVAAADSMLYLDHLTLSGIETVDSVRLTADGAFAFTQPAAAAPEFYQLRLAAQTVTLSIDSTETVTVTARWPHIADGYRVEGSANCERIRQLSLLQQQLQRQVADLDRNTILTPQQKSDNLQALLKRHKENVKANYIFSAPEQASAYYALFQTIGPWLIFNPKDDPDDMKVFAAVATSWDTYYPEALRTKNLHNIAVESLNTNRILRARSEQAISSDVIDVSGIIDLTLNDNHGNERSLSALAGKVVLLDFHSFRLPDSPQRILFLRGLYNKYHARGLEIFQVCLDNDHHFWQQKTAELPWICVEDPTAEAALRYNVTELPEFFTIDRMLTLQHRSSQIDDIDKEIEQLLN